MPLDELLERRIPWKVIAASPDMMDVTAGNRRFPFMWRSSLAISVFEPPPREEEEDALCGQRLSFVKVTCSLTGYEARSGDTSPPTFAGEPLEELERLISRYLGCYGALLNVAFFPLGAGPAEEVDPARLPHVLDFSPKSRELIRSITEDGETLTGSSRELKFDESRTTTEKNETTVGVEAGYEAGGLKATGNVAHTWGSTREDKEGTSMASGGTRQASERFSTTMDQLYSLLTGYHAGTNRSTFILLARPGTLQPTDRRTFVQGLRMLEGIQEFVFVVSRPADVEGLCIEAALDTGHFPEDAELVSRDPETRSFRFSVYAHAQGRGGFVPAAEENMGQEIVIPDGPEHTFDLRAETGGGEWVVDTGRPGGWFEEVEDRSRLWSPEGHRLESDGVLTSHPALSSIPLSLRRLDEHTVQAYLTVTPIHARGNRYGREHQLDTIVDKEFVIHARRRVPRVEQTADTAQMLVTRRTLSTCYRSENGCPVVTGTLDLPEIDPSTFLETDTGLGLGGNVPTARLYAGLQRALTAATTALARGAERRPLGETDYFVRAVAQQLPPEEARVPLDDAIDCDRFGKDVAKRLESVTVGQVLPLGSRALARRAGMSDEGARELRGALLRHLEGRFGGETGGKPAGSA